MNTLVGRLDAWLAAHRPGFHAALNPGATPAALDALAARAGHALPPLLRELLTWRDGEPFDRFAGLAPGQVWMSITRITEELQLMDGMAAAGEFGSPDWWRRGWLPFLENGAGDLVCIDLVGSFDGEPGQIIEFVHDDAARTITYPSLAGWLGTLVEALEAGLLVEDYGDIVPVDEAALAAWVAARNPGYPIRRQAV